MDENATVGPSTHHRKPSGSNMPVAKKPSLGPSAGGKAAVPTRRGAFADVSNKTKVRTCFAETGGAGGDSEEEELVVLSDPSLSLFAPLLLRTLFSLPFTMA